MSVMVVAPSIGAGVSNPNIFTGSAFEFVRRRAIVSMGIMQAATGTFAQFTSGGDVIAEEFEPPIATRYPIIPDEMYFTDVAEAGDRLRVPVRNPTGGAIIVRSIAQITDV